MTGDVIALHDGRVLEVHDPAVCAGGRCCIHDPSPHHMATWPLNWRTDWGGFMERICPHGIGHPDPDDRRYTQMYRGHGCDRCCAPPAVVS